MQYPTITQPAANAQLFEAFRTILADGMFMTWLRTVPNSAASGNGMSFGVGRWGRVVPNLSDLDSVMVEVPAAVDVDKIKRLVARVKAEAILIRDGANVTISRLAVSMLGYLSLCVCLTFDCEDTDENGLIEPTVIFQHESFIISVSP